jgi:hypothetical protein
MAHSSETELKIVSAGENLQRENGRVSSMDSAVPDARLSFRVYIIRLHGPENDPMVRVLLVETSKTKSIYEGFGSLSQCERWVVQLTVGSSPEMCCLSFANAGSRGEWLP